MFIVRIVEDGNAWGAINGPDLAVGIAGFGTTHADALRDLADRLDEENRDLQ